MRGEISPFAGSAPLGAEVTSSAVKSLVPADGTVPAGRTVITWSGTVVATTANGTSAVAVAFPQPFPNGVLAVLVTVDNASGAGEAQLWQEFCDLTQFTVVVRTSGGGALAGSGVRFSYIAKGW